MSRNTKKKTAKCELHEFLLKPRGEYNLHPQYLQVSFCQQQLDKERKQQSDPSGKCLNCPVFNFDRNFATPTFILTSEKV